MWHFTKYDKKLRYSDERIVKAGETLSVEGDICMCNNGLHACKNLLDALYWGPSLYLWKVELSGDVEHEDRKSVARYRKALWGFNATNVLKDFARKAVQDALDLWVTSADASSADKLPDAVREFVMTGKKPDHLSDIITTVYSGGYSTPTYYLKEAIHGLTYLDTGDPGDVICEIERALRNVASARAVSTGKRGWTQKTQRAYTKIHKEQNALLEKAVIAEARRRKRAAKEAKP